MAKEPEIIEEEKKIEVGEKTLKALIKTVETLQESNDALVVRDKKREGEIEMLKNISDKGRLSKYEDSQKGPLIPTAKVSFWNDLPILAWSKGKDEVGFRDGRLTVNQTIKLFLDEGKKEPKEVEVDYLFWAQNTSSQSGEVVERSENENGQYWTMQLKDGRKIKLDIRFINAF